MPSVWPSALDTFTAKTDGVDDILAAHMNAVQDGVSALETELGTGGLKGTLTSLTARLAVGIAADGTIIGGALPSPLPANSVDTISIKDGAVSTSKIGTGVIITSHITPLAIVNSTIADTTITGGKLANSTITSTQLDTGSVSTPKIQDFSVTPVKLTTGLRAAQDVYRNLAAAGTATVRALGTPTTSLLSSGNTNPSHPRNVSHSLKNTTGGALTSNTVTLTVIGFDALGAYLTEAIQIPTQSIGAGATVTVFGVKAFSSITSVQLDNAQGTPANWQFSVGTGDLLGVKNTIASLYKATKNGSDIATLPTVSTTNGTVDLSTIVANDDVTLWYLKV